MPSSILVLLFACGTSLVHAILEIQIEGPNGWAKALPTKKFTGWIARNLTEVGYITGFHAATLAFIALLAHFPVLFVSDWTWQRESAVLGFLFFHFTFEDFFWFVLNPSYGIAKFKKQHIWWHRHWIFGLPASYWLGIILGLVFLFIAGTA